MLKEITKNPKALIWALIACPNYFINYWQLYVFKEDETKAIPVTQTESAGNAEQAGATGGEPASSHTQNAESKPTPAQETETLDLPLPKPSVQFKTPEVIPLAPKIPSENAEQKRLKEIEEAR